MKSPLRDELKKNIRKLISPIKDESSLEYILKVKLTKKELKIFRAWAYGDELYPILEKLNIDDKRYKTIKEKLIKKINQEKFKHEIMI